mmetsp:Transcript_83005/g.146642  ORF Transcript_83005/g.146642 Transcript_83005/m.146642 type:complete len:176 (+) Transcript_83005:69-596(+)|eukprot:CAMPEP_0197655538 /NCGR_PEP_ID=MMETSP1338-20131121/39509_1 /TAXON_ID=43686 ORGANISM="Pelagodinium beii, Strain RCC1491" /NCGR_SAMPLE_ID=MMETSP1338 /ASSEMBLY_ACC=CAM_ASM_000754 /LENGTH=175 /DNA_ID=CAMNT_0043231197 /DNA_START=68 /DNA_END=595 /DNA_ORIENTATION=-
MVAGPNERKNQIGKSTALGGSGTSLAQNSAARRALAAEVTIKAVSQSRRSPDQNLTHAQLRLKDSKEGLNQLGMSQFPKQKEGWDWCVKGANQPAHPSMKKSTADGEVIRGLSRAESYVPCPDGVEKPFFGEARAYGESAGWDGRMRGGELARTGWAGTFPISHSRGCMPWAAGG